MSVVAIVMALIVGSSAWAGPRDQKLQNERQPRDIQHQDGRGTPKIRFYPATDRLAPNLKGKVLAESYVREYADEYRIALGLASLGQPRLKKSLIGDHYRFPQFFLGIPVLNAAITVSIRNDREIYRIYNNTFPIAKDQPVFVGEHDDQDFYDLVWNFLKADGTLLERPTISRAYVASPSASLRPVHIVRLAVAQPFGYWEAHIDDLTGKIIKLNDRRLVRRAVKRSAFRGTPGDRRKAFLEFYIGQNLKVYGGQNVGRADGTGVVFDPDPRTTLMDNTLEDDSPADLFADAYFTRDLLELTVVDDEYSLVGPWVQLADFEAPRVDPSTTPDGNWTAMRGDLSFNDAMTYFHVDQSQRYMQSLGFVGDSGIQYGSIEVDANGVNGSDNSHYIPGSNRMAFGHGCVDDNEDADVILHEYGHAIHFSINPDWSGGDTGAIGEGFGDYWAGSYSIATVNGDTFKVNQVFTWDGHGESNECWPGRILDAFEAQYDPNRTYGAHSRIPGGFQSDELWSTPLFQSLLALIEAGVPREEVDRIILESHFGLGSGTRMRGLAEVTIQTANELYPDGPHAEVFVDKFLVHNIVEVARASLSAGEPELNDAGSNGVLDPGETVSIVIPVQNDGTLAATNVGSQLTTQTSGATLLNDRTVYPDTPARAISRGQTPFRLRIDEGFTCGDKVELSMNLSYDNGVGNPPMHQLQIQTGIPQGIDRTSEPSLEIPDNDPEGVTATLEITGTDARVSRDNFRVGIDLTHTYIGDLRITLESPAGTVVVLHDRGGGSDDDLIGTYPSDLTPVGSFLDLMGEAVVGTWKLQVVDGAGQDVGTLNAWSISDVTGYVCE